MIPVDPGEVPRDAPSSRPGKRRWGSAAWLIVLLPGILAWLFLTAPGLVLLGAILSIATGGGVRFDGLEGTLSGPLAARSVYLASGDTRIVARDVRLDWEADALLDGRLEIIALTAGDVEIAAPVTSTAASLPSSLEFPLALSVRQLAIGRLRMLQAEAAVVDFEAMDLAAVLASDGRGHRFSLDARIGSGNLTASGELQGTLPFALDVRAGFGGGSPGTMFSHLPQPPDIQLMAHFTGSLEQLDVDWKMEERNTDLAAAGRARLRPYATHPIAALQLSVSHLDPRAIWPGAPAASLAVQADVHETHPGQLEGGMTMENRAAAPLDRGGFPLQRMRARIMLSGESLRLGELVLAFEGGGRISGDVAWLRGVDQALADLVLDRIDPATLDSRLHAARLSGVMRLEGDAHAQRASLALRDQALGLDLTAERTGDTLALSSLRLGHGASTLTGHGVLELDGRQSFAFEGGLRQFDLSAFARVPPTRLDATLELRGERVPRLSGTMRFDVRGNWVAGQPVRGEGRIGFSGETLAAAQASGKVDLRVGVNHLSAQGELGRKGERLQLALTAPMLEQIGYGLGGSLTVAASLKGRVAGGERVWPDVVFSAQGNTLVFPGRHRLRHFQADGRLQGDVVALEAAAADYATTTGTRLQELRLTVDGSRARHRLQAIVRQEGRRLNLRAEGGMQPPEKPAAWTGTLVELSVESGLPLRLVRSVPLEIGERRATLGAAEFAVAGGSLKLVETAWEPGRWVSRGMFSGMRLRLADLVVTDEEGTGPALHLGGDWSLTSAAQLVGSLKVGREQGDWVLPGSASSRHLGLQVLQLSARAGEGRVTAQLDVQGEQLGAMRARVSAPLGSAAEGSAGGVLPPGAPVDGQLSLEMEDASWLGPLVDINLRSGGRILLEADVVGTVGRPRLKGRIQGDGLVLALLDQGVRLEQGRLAARFDDEALHMDVLSFAAPHAPPPADRLLRGAGMPAETAASRFSGITAFLGEYGGFGEASPRSRPSDDRISGEMALPDGPGSLQASGTLNFRDDYGNLEFALVRLPVSQRPDRWVILSGKGRARFDRNALTLDGNLVADAGLIAQPQGGRPQLAEDVVVTGREVSERKALRIRLGVELDLGRQFYIRASGLEGRLDGRLHVSGEPGQSLRTTGTITARNASFEAYGQRLAVERGIVNFQGAMNDPGLNVLAVRKGLPVEAGVEVTGSVRQPVVRLVSTPAVSDLEKLSWITLGRPPEGKADASLLLTAANAILGSQSGGVTEKIAQVLGVDDISIRQAQPLGGDVLAGQIGTVGKRLSSRAYISYEQALTAAAGITKLTYSLTPRITIVTRAGIDNAIDVLYTLRFD